MVMAVFRSRLLDEGAAEFNQLAAEMLEIAQGMPGFISYQVYKAEDGARCSIIEFDTQENLLAWREQPRHRAAQEAGRQRFYSSYSLHVAEPERESLFER
jgi:heme-degrading monooxygenase HmoA